MAKEEIVEKGLVQSVIEPLEREGSVGRLSLGNLFGLEGASNIVDDAADALAGDKRYHVRNFMKDIYKKTGFDPYFGGVLRDRYEWEGKPDLNWAEKGGNFLIDAMVDIGTSPSTYVGGAAFKKAAQIMDGIDAASKFTKIAKLDDISKAIGANPIVRSTVPKKFSRAMRGAGRAAPLLSTALKNEDFARGAIGGTMGLLNVDPEDSFGEAAEKVAIGTGMGLGLNPSIKALGQAGKYAGSNAINNSITRRFPEAIDMLKNNSFVKNLKHGVKKIDYAKAKDITTDIKLERELAKQQRKYLENIGPVFDYIYDDVLKSTGLKDAADEAVSKFRDMLGIGFSRVVKTRNAANYFIKSVRKGEQIGIAKNKDRLVNVLSEQFPEEQSLKLADEMFDIASSTTDNSLTLATDMTNDIFSIRKDRAEGLIDIADDADDLIFYSDRLIEEMNIPESLQDTFRFAIQNYDDAQKRLAKDYTEHARKTGTKNAGYTNLNFHTIDLKELDKEMDILEKTVLGKVVEGAKKRQSDKVLTRLEDMSNKDVMEIGARRFASLYLTRQQKEAKQLVKTINDLKRNRQANSAFDFVQAYDDLLHLTKANWLGNGVGWMVNTLNEGVLKAYVATGASPMIKTLGQGVGNALYEATLAKEIGKFKLFQQGGMLEKIGNTMTGKTGGYTLSAKDPYWDVLSDLGVVDNTFVDQAKKMADEGMDVFEMVVSKDNKAVIADTLSAARKGTMRNLADYIWRYSPFAKLATGFENGLRMGTFKALFETEMLARGVPKESVDYILKSGIKKAFTATSKKMKNPSRYYQEANDAMVEAARKVNDVFYDYARVNAAEQYIAKRFIPFYSFVSKDVEFWSRAMFDNPRAGGAFEATMQAIGREPTEMEYAGMPRYMIDQGARIDLDEGRAMTLPTTAGLSAINAVDALPLVGGGTEGFMSNVAPVPRTAIQLAANRDDFGRPIYSDRENPIVRIQNTPITSMLDEYALDAWLDAKRDPNTGKIYSTATTSPAALYTVEKTLPVNIPLINALTSRIELDRARGIAPEESLRRTLSPVKIPNYEDRAKSTRERRIRNMKMKQNKAITPSERSFNRNK